MADNGVSGIADLRPLARAREQKAWYWYDWANSAYVTTVSTVMLGPYLIAIAKNAAVDNRIDVLGLSIAPGALPSYLVTFSTILSAILLPLLGAVADRTANKKGLLAGFAWTGAAFASLLFFCKGENWQIGAIAVIGANLCLGASTVFNDSILPLISTEEERDRVSSRGWAWGYLGGGLLLVVNLVMFLFHDTFGMSEGFSVRLSMLSAAIWWAGFTFIPYLRLRNHEPVHVVAEEGGIISQSFGQLWATLKDMKNYPMALTFLGAYLFFNDGIQTVIASSSIYGAEELGFGTSVLIGTILMVQFVAFAGALVFGKAAEKYGAKQVILVGLVIWMAIVAVALVLPKEQIVPFLAMGFAIGLVLGGTQALARSYFSLLIPRGREGEFFSFYHAMDRGTSWFGTLTFGVVYQLTDSYRPAIFALIAFFVLGGLLLLKVDTARGIREAGNVEPSVI
ncbi:MULTISPECIES: MFS transporter [unclassified Nocardioides]|uniref:MFS transporter n=1 Tax=unclassified Nocardioides TaxID=2615069 RepID=UPI0006FBA0A8|nr:MULTISPECIES: MFS transporter [unclassified Nocardioides]KQY64496.1 MFS transporter [Nocardioides sp. Root140]KQZ70421.1 MFS transporter [Nocardioides sp. Root151]